MGRMKVDVYPFDDGEWVGFLPAFDRQEQLGRHVWPCWVAGLAHYEGSQGKDFGPGSDVLLIPEPDNPHDASAVGVWNAAHTGKIGHLPAPIVAGLPTAIEHHGVVAAEMHLEGERVGLWLLVSHEPIALRAVKADSEAHVARQVQRMKHVVVRARERWERVVETPLDPLEAMRLMTETPEGGPPLRSRN